MRQIIIYLSSFIIIFLHLFIHLSLLPSCLLCILLLLFINVSLSFQMLIIIYLSFMYHYFIFFFTYHSFIIISFLSTVFLLLFTNAACPSQTLRFAPRWLLGMRRLMVSQVRVNGKGRRTPLRRRMVRV